MGGGTGAGVVPLVGSQRATDSSLVEFCTSLEAKCRWWKSQKATIYCIVMLVLEILIELAKYCLDIIVQLFQTFI